MRADPIRNVDIGIIKNTQVAENVRAQLWVDCFNAFNSRNFGIPSGMASSPGFLTNGPQMEATEEFDSVYALYSESSLVVPFSSEFILINLQHLLRKPPAVSQRIRALLNCESFAEGGSQGFLRAMTDERLPANLTSYSVATFHAALGESDKAFIELNRAYQNREGILGLLNVDPRFDSLHDDPRFEDLARRFKIAPQEV
jgi:hypothetical protein